MHDHPRHLHHILHHQQRNRLLAGKVKAQKRAKRRKVKKEKAKKVFEGKERAKARDQITTIIIFLIEMNVLLPHHRTMAKAREKEKVRERGKVRAKVVTTTMTTTMEGMLKLPLL
jgi:hypothetical protein